MRIVMNYTGYSTNRITGQNVFLEFFLKGLSQLEPENEYMIYCSEKVIPQLRELFSKGEYIPAMDLSARQKRNIIDSIKKLIYRIFVLPARLKENNPDLIFFPDIQVSLFNYYKGIKTVMNPHDIQFITFPRRVGLIHRLYFSIIYRAAFKNMDKIIAISNCDKGQMETAFPSYKHKVHKIANPVDTSGLPGAEERNNDIIAINIQHKHKNIITLIKAFEKIKEDISGNLILIGSPYKDDLEYVKENELSKRIIFKGIVSNEERNSLLKKSRLYVNPTTYEGFGITNVEAIAAGTPCLISDIEVNKEVTLGLASYYGPATDIEELAKAILKKLNQEVDRGLLLERAKRISKEYDTRKMIGEYQTLFNNLMRENCN